MTRNPPPQWIGCMCREKKREKADFVVTIQPVKHKMTEILKCPIFEMSQNDSAMFWSFLMRNETRNSRCLPLEEQN